METGFELTEQNYRYLFENASDAMWVQDMEGNIVDANMACEKLTGFTREELLSKNVRDFVTGEFLELARGVRRKLLNGEEIIQPYEQRLFRKDGTTGIMKMATSLVIIDGGTKGFQHVARDVTEEKRMQENMRFYVQQITRAQEDERKRVARELHDESSPPLLLLIQRLDAIVSSQKPRLPQRFKDDLEDIRTQAIEVLEGLRRYAQELRPRILDDIGLVAALEWMAENLVKDYGIETKVRVAGVEQSLPDEAQLLLFRIVQEALSNIRRHANAPRAWITMEFHDDKLSLIVKDNGKGFEIPQRIGDLASIGKLGLAGMQERSRLLGANLEIKSAPGKGTIITVEVPI